MISSTIAAVRTVVSWLISISVGWEKVLWLEVVGMVILLFGSLFYNRVIPMPRLDKYESDRMNRNNGPTLLHQEEQII